MSQHYLNEFGAYQRHVARKKENGIRFRGFKASVNTAERSAFWHAVATNDADWQARRTRRLSNVAEHGGLADSEVGLVATHASAQATREDANFKVKMLKIYGVYLKKCFAFGAAFNHIVSELLCSNTSRKSTKITVAQEVDSAILTVLSEAGLRSPSLRRGVGKSNGLKYPAPCWRRWP